VTHPLPLDRMTDRATLEARRQIGRRVLLEIWSQGRLDLVDELYAGLVPEVPGT
jgi:hypothetical protein